MCKHVIQTLVTGICSQMISKWIEIFSPQNFILTLSGDFNHLSCFGVRQAGEPGETIHKQLNLLLTHCVCTLVGSWDFSDGWLSHLHFLCTVQISEENPAFVLTWWSGRCSFSVTEEQTFQMNVLMYQISIQLLQMWQMWLVELCYPFIFPFNTILAPWTHLIKESIVERQSRHRFPCLSAYLRSDN